MVQIIGLDGGLGSGKSITAVMLLKDDYATGKKIISTTQLFNIPYKYITSEDLADFIIENHTPDKQKIVEDMFSNSSLFIDEIRVLISSRKSSSNLNELMTSFFMLLGKLDTNLYMTFQKFSMVDIQVRNIMDFVIRCKRVNINGIEFAGPRIPYITPEGKIIPIQQKTEKDKPYPIFINCKLYEVINPDEIKYTGMGFTYNPEQYFNNYNTREIVLVDRERYLKK